MLYCTDSSILHSLPTGQTDANVAGRQRCATGVLARSPHTAELLPADYAALDFIVIENFLGATETATLLQSFAGLRGTLNNKNLNNAYWQGRILFAHEVNAHSPAAGSIMQHFQVEAARQIGNFYQLTHPLYADTVQLVLWQEGVNMPAHADNANPDGSPHGMAWRNFSSIVYLNDDYDGGELYFTALDRYLKPKAGMLVAFTAGFHHEHSVLKVTRGERFTMPGFYTYDASKADRFIYPELWNQP